MASRRSCVLLNVEHCVLVAGEQGAKYQLQKVSESESLAFFLSPLGGFWPGVAGPSLGLGRDVGHNLKRLREDGGLYHDASGVTNCGHG